MALTFKWDQRDRHRIRYSRQGIEITRGCMVTGVTVTPDGGGTDPEVWIRVLGDAACPKPGLNAYPSATIFGTAILDEIVPASVGPAQPNSWVRMDAVYRTATPSGGGGTGASAWTITDTGQGAWVPAFATYGGVKPLTVWYRKGEPAATAVAPASTAARPTTIRQVRGGRKFHPTRTMRATGVLLADDWATIKGAVRDATGRINTAPWGFYPRGTWLFMYPSTRTADAGRSFSVELLFLYEPEGHWTIGAYTDEHGDHPADCASIADLFAGGPPPYTDIIQRNGLMAASTQGEIDFNSVFSFTPD